MGWIPKRQSGKLRNSSEEKNTFNIVCAIGSFPVSGIGDRPYPSFTAVNAGKFEIPNRKFQTNPKLQILNSNTEYTIR